MFSSQDCCSSIQPHINCISHHVSPPHLQVVLWHDDRAAPRDVCTGVLAVTMRVISLPQVLVGCTLSERTETTSTNSASLISSQEEKPDERLETENIPAEQHRPHPAPHTEGPLQVIDGLRKQLILRTHTHTHTHTHTQQHQSV